MPTTPTAVFAQLPKSNTAVVTTATAALATDAPTGTVLLVTAGVNGCIVTRLTAMPRATMLSTALYSFTSPDGGVTQRLKDSETMAGQTIGTGTRIDEIPFGNYSEARPMRLGPNERLYVGTGIAANIVFAAEWTDF